MMNRWRAIEAENNAHWCDLVVRSHGGQGVFSPDAWTSPTRTPPLFPDAVTLIPSPRVPDLLSRIDALSGCTIKDSFASLDLTADGFNVLFDAQWITSPAHPDTEWGVPPDWVQITDPDGFGLWKEAWCHPGGPRDILLPELLSEGAVVLGRIKNDRVIAGGIVSGSARVAGLSNVFTGVGHESETWSALAQCARAFFPGLPLIGYERGEELAHAQSGGFQTAGALRVWITST
jgi:hypothetical protein